MRASTALAALAIVALSARAEAWDDVVHGATVSPSFSTTPVGDTIMGEIGGLWGGLRTLDGGRWLLQWEMLLAVKGGYLGNQHPFLFLIGPHASSFVEAGYRFRHNNPFSPYLGVRLAGDAQLLESPDASSFETINSAAGVGGPVAHGALRLAAGNAYLDDVRSLLIALYFQEEVDGPQIGTPSRAFSDLGIEVRYDLARSMWASLDARCGLTFDSHDDLRGTSDSTMRCGLSVLFRKIFHNGMWVGAALTYQRDTDHVVYENGLTYETGDAPVFFVSLSYGLPLWRSR